MKGPLQSVVLTSSYIGKKEAKKAWASPGISAEAWLRLQVRGGEAPQCCLEKGKQAWL
jgi:hypothetical protein